MPYQCEFEHLAILILMKLRYENLVVILLFDEIVNIMVASMHMTGKWAVVMIQSCATHTHQLTTPLLNGSNSD